MGASSSIQRFVVDSEIGVRFERQTDEPGRAEWKDRDYDPSAHSIRRLNRVIRDMFRTNRIHVRIGLSGYVIFTV